jgi:iron complex transport system substrate-binding protein
VRAVAAGHVYEVKSSLILQPGPAALTDGVEELMRIVEAAAHGTRLPTALTPEIPWNPSSPASSTR